VAFNLITQAIVCVCNKEIPYLVISCHIQITCHKAIFQKRSKKSKNKPVPMRHFTMVTLATKEQRPRPTCTPPSKTVPKQKAHPTVSPPL
jgi:hypothetical protein